MIFVFYVIPWTYRSRNTYSGLHHVELSEHELHIDEEDGVPTGQEEHIPKDGVGTDFTKAGGWK